MQDILVPFSMVFDRRLLHIPDYQRGYAWDERQWDDLINDLEYLPVGKSHFPARTP